ncbi:hypothetical protein NHQ30_007899 [Ciborinia camelliae]|nr:hypothetical protein NHQ30_007899 [Ciborinia camelliae]
MKFSYLAQSVFCLQRVGAYLVTPDGPAAPGSTTDCSLWVEQSYGITCAIIEEFYGVTEALFEEWNPSTTFFGDNCTLLDEFYYCVQVDFSTLSTMSYAPPTDSATYSSAMLTTFVTTTTGNTITTPTPYQTGISSTCDSFYLVASGDSCSVIATDAGITLDQFYAWNPAVGTSCEYLDLGDYVCIDITGVAVTPAPTATSNDITTPTPYQTGIASTCDSFYLVASGDSCSVIATNAGITLDQFYAWNPAVGTSCEYLDLGDYVCIDIIGVTVTPAPTTTTTTTSTSTSTSTSSSDGVSTPAPIQTGMTSTCDSFHLVVSGDSCYDIATDAGITLDDFYLWNPAVGSSCAYLDIADYVCIGVL